ncbi:MAG: UvrD-helicase domain-containing protein [Bacilli bacterium]|nr:UvrD-helicase domain-containing protein [Bacilli bacterium]
MNQILKGLNLPQIEAVKHYEGPLLVMAGAGSGKTKVLTHRIAYLIEERQVSPRSILAITFTNKAAKEMKERVTKLIGAKAKDMHISTFHSFCVYILRQDIDVLGYKHNFIVYDDTDSINTIKAVLHDLNIDSKHYPPKKVLSLISQIKNEYLFPEDYRKEVSDEFSDMIYRVYKKYQESLRRANALDFDDLIMLALKLFEVDKEVLNYYQQRFQFILVDEYQDTNKSQFKLVKYLSAKHKNVFAVGDTDQSIYSWRGADIRNIKNFEKDFEQAKIIYLEQNYRSVQSILDVANCLIKHNYPSDKYVKQLWSDRKSDYLPVYYRAVNSDVETEYIALKILEKIDREGYNYKDFAILYRTNAMSLALETTLKKYHIDYEIYGNVSFFERKEIKDLGAYLRLIVNTDDDTAFLRIVNVPRRNIGEKTIEDIKHYANEHELSLFESCKILGNERAKQNLLIFVNLIEDLQKPLANNDLDINDFIDLVLEKTGYREMLELEDTEEAESRLENLDEFKTLTLDIEEDLNELGMATVDMTNYDKLCLILNNVTLSSDKREKKENAVKLMTIHAAKGLEFPIVFIYGVEENIFPLRDDVEELEEERRLMYVACTRAMNELYITNSEQRKIYGQYRMNPESRFLSEIDPDLLSYQGVRKIKVMQIEKSKPQFTSVSLPTLNDKKSENIKKAKIGTKILHSRFGEGIIVSLDGDIATIAFSAAHGIMKLDINHPAITIL